MKVDNGETRLEWHPDWMRIGQCNESINFLHPSGRLIEIYDLPAFERLLGVVERGRLLSDLLVGQVDDECLNALRIARKLLSCGVLIQRLPSEIAEVSSAQMIRLQPQLVTLSSVLSSSQRAITVQRRISAGKVVVVGAGGSGSMTVLHLAAAGVRNIRIVDHDIVSLSNLGRQLLYKEADIGKPKVAALKKFMEEYDSEINVESLRTRVTNEESAFRVVTGCDIAVITADDPWPSVVRWIGRAGKRAGVAVLPTFFSSFGPLIVPGKGPCIDCVLLWMEKNGGQGLTPVLQSLSPIRSHNFGGMGIGTTAAGVAYAREVISFLSGVLPVRSQDGLVKARTSGSEVMRESIGAICDNCLQTREVTQE